MRTQYRCALEDRKTQVRETLVGGRGILNGIDYLEVSDNQVEVYVHFIHPLSGSGKRKQVPPKAPPLGRENIIIDGGVRIRDIHVKHIIAHEEVLTVKVSTPGDFSTYTLRLVNEKDGGVPAGYDSLLSEVDFSFKVNCPSEFDCKPSTLGVVESLPEPVIDYMSKDYASFRRLMLDRLAVTMPDWQERNPADLYVTLVELLAHTGDQLSYYQDAVATEAYLDTARRRVSVRRHARLLDYVVHEGCNARAWVTVSVAPDVNGANEVTLTGPKDGHAGTWFLTRVDAPLGRIDPNTNVIQSREVQFFESMHDAKLRASHNEISFYTWGEEQCCLPRGATKATLKDKGRILALEKGDVLIIEEVLGPNSGLPWDADPAHRQAVRLTKVSQSVDKLYGEEIVEVEWGQGDTLTFPLTLSATISNEGGKRLVQDISVARGNMILVDNGRTVDDEFLKPDTVPDSGVYRPSLERTNVTYRVPYNHAEATARPESNPASEADEQDPRRALASVSLLCEGDVWKPVGDLLGSDRFATDFVVEVEDDGQAYLRFGDDLMGAKPKVGSKLKPLYRVGNGSEGSVGAEAIVHVVTSVSGITGVRNPLPARGGTDPEPTEKVRLYAPHAFRTQERAVTESDYEQAAQRHPQVQRAAATLRWTGSWHTMFVTVDRKGGLPIDDSFREELLSFLERFRLAGCDVEVDAPRFVPLDISMTVCVKPGYPRDSLKAALLEAFSSADLPRGQRGFFHPDNFTFGQPVYLSRVMATAKKVPGVDWITMKDGGRFQRWGCKARGELAEGMIRMERLEIARLDNDPNAPENGRIEFIVRGGV